MPTIDSKQFVYIYYNNPLLAIVIHDDNLRPLINKGELRLEIGFALSSEDMRTIRFDHQGKFIEIKPGQTGLPTVRDLDVLLYCSSWLSHESFMMKTKTGKVGNASNTVTIIPEDFYEFSKRGRGGSRQASFVESLVRLNGCIIATNIGPKDNKESTETRSSAMLTYELEKSDDVIKQVHITFSEMMLRIVAHTGVRLALHPDFFAMRPLQKALYLLLKQNCGTECPWTVSIEDLHRLTGSTAKLPQFKQNLRDAIAAKITEFQLSANDDVSQIYCTQINVITPKYSAA